MYVLITYDVASSSASGSRRLRRVAKVCSKYGQRVQLSVFECLVDSSQFELVKHELLKIIDPKRDSLRFYNLGKNWQRRVEHFGAKSTYDPEDVLIV